jgi:HNH endonuclease
VKIKKGSSCHYCKKAATTRDHIVPKCIVNARYDRKISNFVPCCTDCNRKKANKRSNCPCNICELAWETYGPPNYIELEVIDMLGLSEDFTLDAGVSVVERVES